MPTVPSFAVRETASLGQQMLNATVGTNGLNQHSPPPGPDQVLPSTHLTSCQADGAVALKVCKISQNSYSF